MTQALLWRYAALLAMTVVPLTLPGLKATSFGGWPAMGFAAALFVTAGRRHRWPVFAVVTALDGLALTLSYHVFALYGLLGSLTISLPALLAAWLLTREDPGPGGGFRLPGVDVVTYHAVTAVAGLLCGLLATLAVASLEDADDVLLTGLMSFLAGTTALLVVLPLLMRTPGDTRTEAGPAELTAQRLLLLGLTVSVFAEGSRVGVAFLLFPIIAWAAMRASRREAHVQLLLVSLAAYALTSLGLGPLSVRSSGLPDRLAPTLVYLFIAALCYLTVPLALTVQRLVSVTEQATRSASTVERMLDAATGTLVMATDARGRTTHFNVGAQEALGYEPAEVLGRNPRMFHTQAEIARQAAHFRVPADHGQVVLAQVRSGEKRDWEVRCRDGTARMVSLNLSEITDAAGKVVGYIATGEDITERLRAHQALMAALDREHASVLRLQEVDHVKEELISNVSHELRTPITSINGYTELLRDGDLGDLSAQQADAVRRIERNSARLGLLVEDLLTVSRAESGDLELVDEVVDLRQPVRDAVEMLQDIARARPLEVAVDLAPGPVHVLGDHRALERVATNLLSNAIKFTPGGGRIRVSVSAPDAAVLEVGDTGMGISQEDQRRLFTRFFRAAAATTQAIQGTGLGLSIVHAIVTRHGGTVTLRSEPGQGTTVTVRLPRMPTPPG